MKQIMIEAIAALREADDESDMILIVLTMNARLPAVFHVHARYIRSTWWDSRSVDNKRAFYVRQISHQITMWKLMEANGSLAKWL